VNLYGGITRGRALMGILVIIVIGGFVLSLTSTISGGLDASGAKSLNPSFGAVASLPSSVSNSFNDYSSLGGNYIAPGNTEVVSQGGTVTATTTVSTTTVGVPPTHAASNLTQGSPGGLIEFSSAVSIRTATPEQAASGVVALAYSVGGYVAYQSTYSNSAYVVIRVPAAEYQQVLTKVEGMGTVISLTSNSNDVRVQYTDLNATLASLKTEQGALLKLLNQSATINSTLAVEGQLQGVNQQINEVESEILQTKTLIEYSTINVTISETAAQVPLSIALSATPTNGTSPLSVTFNAVVKGGSQPYVVNYNFGDGYASEGHVVIHTYFQAGAYKVLVSATDQNGTVAQATTVVKVVAVLSTSGVGAFFGHVGDLFLNVVEGIVEVAAVVLPIAAVGAAIVIPVQRRSRNQKDIKQSQ
jgi:hypothetical protein